MVRFHTREHYQRTFERYVTKRKSGKKASTCILYAALLIYDLQLRRIICSLCNSTRFTTMLMIRAMSLTVLLVNLSTLTTQKNVQLSRGAPAFPKNTCDTTCQRRPDDNGMINLLIDKWKHASSRSQKTEVLKIIETKIAQFPFCEVSDL